jgi:hypothetical protein
MKKEKSPVMMRNATATNLTKSKGEYYRLYGSFIAAIHKISSSSSSSSSSSRSAKEDPKLVRSRAQSV